MHHSVSFKSGLAMLVIAAALPVAPANAQQGALVFKNFRTYPQGQWLKEMTATRDNVAFGPPQTQTTCASPLDPRAAGAAVKLGNTAASTCTMRVLKDEEKTLEYEQVCPMGASQQVMHATVRAIDDRTMTMDTAINLPGMGNTVTHTKASYQGPCQISTAAASSPALPATLPPVDCAELAELRQNIQEGAAQCAQMPAGYRPQCEARLDMGRKALAMQGQRCK